MTNFHFDRRQVISTIPEGELNMIIDADAHVEESEAMFDRLDKEFRPRRPLPVRFATDTVYGKYNAVWLIDGETYPKLVGKGGTIFRTPTLMEAASLKRESIGAQEMTDIDARLRDMDKVKIDTQVVFPSLFLTTTAEELSLEAALLRAYNSFLGECSAASKGRIRFAALVPIRFHSILTSAAFERIPNLRFAFLEAGCGWVPYLVRQVRRDNARRRKAKDPVEYFKAGRVFVTCEADEDINGVAELIGEDSFIIGSDYPHGDPSRQEDMIAEFRQRKDLSPPMVEKMLSDNPRRLYGL